MNAICEAVFLFILLPITVVDVVAIFVIASAADVIRPLLLLAEQRSTEILPHTDLLTLQIVSAADAATTAVARFCK